MERRDRVVLENMCMIRDGSKVLVEDKISSLISFPISFVVTTAVDKVIAPAFARGDYLKILNTATYYKSLTDFCGSMTITMEKASIQYTAFVDIIVDQQKAFNALSGDVLSEQAIADFEYFASLPTEEVDIVISGMISLLQDTDEKYDSLKEQNFIQRMFKTVLGKNKATKQEIRDNYDRLTVYVSKSIEILLKRQCVDEKVIQILGSEIISLCKGHVRLTAQVEALTHRVDIPEPAGYLAFLLNTGLIQESIGDSSITDVNHPFAPLLKAVMAVAKAYEFHNFLRMTIATWIVALRNQFISCASIVHFVAFLHLFYTATRRIVEFPRVRVDNIICAF